MGVPPASPPSAAPWEPDLEDGRCIFIINGVLLPHGGAVRALAQGGYLQSEQGAVSAGNGPDQGHL